VVDILLILMVCAFVWIIVYYLFFLLPFAFKLKDEHSSNSVEPLSVVICARNEKEHLLLKVPEILAQDYPDFQLVLVDDCSSDGTWEVMKAFEKKDERVKLVQVNEHDQFYTSKKYALTLGIKAAKHDLLVFTDADCRPNTKTWLQEMSNGMQSKEVLLAYGDYEAKTGFLNALIRFDAFLIASQYAALARKGIVYMGVGRNMAYRKDLFLRNRGFSKHQHIDSGDDDLFIGAVAKPKLTAINMSAEAKTWSEPKTTILEWIRQKGRHLTTFKHYGLKNKVFVGSLSLAQLVALTLGILFLMSPYFLLCIILLSLKALLLSAVMLKLRKEHSLPGFVLIPLIWELFLYAMYPVFFISSKTYKKGTWKI